MTVSTNTNRVSFAGNDVTVAFDLGAGFIFFDDSELRVILKVDATGVETLKTITTHYTVSGGAGATGTVTMVTAPATGETLVIRRVMPLTQGTDLVNNDLSDAEVYEDALDKLTLGLQQLDEVDDRALKFSEGSSFSNINVPDPVATKLLRWDTAGTGLENVAAVDAGLASVSAFMETVLDDTTQAAARTTLGVGTGDSPQFTAINLGHATDTTLSRSAAGKLAVEGIDVVLLSGAQTLTDKTLTAPVINGTVTTTGLTMPAFTLGGAVTANSQSVSGVLNFTNGLTIAGNSDVLDVYDEATWTPVFTFATPGDLNVVYSVQVGLKTIIGRMVEYHYEIQTSTFTHTTASGGAQITGLGSTNLNATGNVRTGHMEFTGITKANFTQFTSNVNANSSVNLLEASGSGQSQAAVTTANMPTTGAVILRTNSKIITA